MIPANNKKIKDNPTCAELLQTAKGMGTLSSVISFFEKLGLKNVKLSEAFKQVPDLVQKTTDLINLPDRFNEHFSKKGWIAFESLKAELMQEAIQLADNGKNDAAEDLLVNQFNEESLNWALTFMKAIEEYHPRDELAQKAKEDYLAGRYHACIPVVLTIIDGIVNDIEQKGFFAKGVNLTAWDSIAAHSSGLQQLCRLFNQTRTKTTTEQISVPYRHGILHGRDLGYANKTVAAKTWAALFAIKDWAMAIKQGKKHPKEKEPEPTFLEVLKSYTKTQEQKRKIEDWKPRVIKLGENCLVTGTPEKYEPESPEKALACFIHYWSNHNYGGMAKLLKTYPNISLKRLAGRLREDLRGKSIQNFKFLGITDKAAAITEILVDIDILYNDKPLKKEIQTRLIYEDAEGNPLIRGEPNGQWLIMEYSLNPIITLIDL